MKVRLITAQQLEINGYTRTRQPGEVLEIGREMATRLIDLGKAQLCEDQKAVIVSLPKMDRPISVTVGKRVVPDFPYPYPVTMVWDGTIPLTREKMLAGFRLLDRWEIAVPLCEYSILALNIGGAADRERTQAVIRDLRVPVYETGLMFVRHTPETAELMKLWKAEDSPQGDTRLAFLRALYSVKPLILALPHTWVCDDE